MLKNLAKKILGSRNDRLLKQYRKEVSKINALEPKIQALSDTELQAKTAEFKQRLADGEKLDNLLVEAFAVCREASQRILNMRHFDVQLIGGMVLHHGKIAEMRTGEGKTLVATTAVYLNALTGRGVHVVTVNDYLAARDASIMRPLYEFLGMTVGVIVSNMDQEDKKAAYQADITYGTNNEYGFDYLRDNMVLDPSEKVQRELSFAVVDEVDSILIDEARTPLIISGQADDNVTLYQVMNQIPPQLIAQKSEEGEGDYWVDEKARQVILSEQGHEHAEEILSNMGLLQDGDSLYSTTNIMLMHHLMAALRAYTLYQRDQHYVVQHGEVVIVDEFTGRLMAGRRWSDGLHQAVEAKEGVEINKENQTLASITFQNFFRLYDKLAGMTGTADTEAFEFQSIYGLETVIIPPNRPMVRKDLNDQIYRSSEEKYEAVVADIKERHAKGQPILVGTTSIENSELVSALLDKEHLQHNVLNAKEHAREADIIAQAGRPGMITVATNMAGRGTDIVLGGNIKPQIEAITADDSLTEADKASRIDALQQQWQRDHDAVIAAGGLHIIGTERHESRRIDNQLRGRAGRQGDAGSSRFYLSFEDPLLRLFALDRATAILNRLAPERGVAIEAGMLNRQIEGAQRKVENRNFDMRKQVLEYDDVANDQRKVIYHQRADILASNDIDSLMQEIRHDAIVDTVDSFIPPDSMEEQWDISGLEQKLAADYHINVSISDWLKEDNSLDNETICERLLDIVEKDYAHKVELVGIDAMRRFERDIMLQIIDNRWREHLADMDYLRQGIHLRGYAQKNPKQEYKREAFEMFQAMWRNIRSTVASLLISVQFEQEQAEEQPEILTAASNENQDFSPKAMEALGIIVRRNDPCPCGSGQKYKQCHGRL
ncbi:MAG: preprotein translocase subunit SecA [Snodgrassella sp.]|uniref:preprotein translocase subunit SecA n=1 Tax=Snodgrassella TaxID=1193515 RepID=UPI0008159FDE|nr:MULTISPECIES: preprotein translocase subunit SecA [Snodgrassella]MCO6506369.1 preprotein translocase subunit SecA [Snodgrassella sp.]MCO6521803.1 preprotein translocase subunit SecA [Snodgrassella sp.]MCO6526924.1 preprotein translocase subunit SecA [Snodgrassella sp.]SCC14088.1 preprotein translocase subunit SecA [Snodgrassella sp. R-53583]